MASSANAERLRQAYEQFRSRPTRCLYLADRTTHVLAFVPAAWEDYSYWRQTDKAVPRRLHILLKELQRTPFEGTGKPELLKHERAGTWSRRITDEYRLVYRVEGSVVWLLQRRYHYNE